MSKRYPEYEGLRLTRIDKEVLEAWEKQGTFERSVSEREGQPTFTFYEGPPSANGMPGIHHVMGRAIKDIFCRYKTLKGFQVKRKGGWDTHGLPVELQVEKSLGITKKDIGKTITIKEYNAACRNDVLKFKNVWDDLTRKMGYWVDLDNPYITYENDYIESVWNLLKRLWDKNYIYKGFTIQPYSPAAGTGLSSNELNMPGAYKEIKDISAVAQFKVTSAPLSDRDDVDTFFLAWTTTPWTLPSNTALAVGKNIVYTKVRCLNRYTGKEQVVILAKDRLNAYFTEQQADLKPEDIKPGNKPVPYLEILGEMKGSELEGMEYEQLLPYVTPDEPAFKVLIGDFVTTEDGTGIVHIAPTFGADDMRVAQKYGIPPLMVEDEDGNLMPLVDKQGRFVSEVTDFAGRYVKDYGQTEDRPVDADIVIKLKEENRLFVSEKYTHNYPHCWRTDRPVLYYPLDSWFIKTTEAKGRLKELNDTINWQPAATGSGRFGNWLENLVDWNLSRSRYWGIPLPVWRTEDGSEEICIGSLEELRDRITQAVDAGVMDNAKAEGFLKDLDLHKPGIDEIILSSPGGKPMCRELDLIDVWFDSGSMPYAQLHYPFENKELFRQSFPADFIAEGVDQTRGWFFTLHAIAVMLEDSVAFKNVIANGLVLDKDGNKMSKRLGNGVDPFKMITEYGADPVRWYMIHNSDPWDNLKFDPDGVKEVRNRYFGTLYNTYSFFSTYANIDNFAYGEVIPLEERSELDRWVISTLNSLIKTVEKSLEDYDPTPAVRAIDYFVTEQLSNWYVRLSRRVFWKGEMNREKEAAYQTLFECLRTVSVLMSPIAPFFSERLYQDLGGGSVLLANFPTVDESAIDTALEERVELARTLTSMILSIRKKEKMRVRQPLHKALVAVIGQDMHSQLEQVADLIKSEVNVKEIEYITGENSTLKKKVNANFKVLGRKLGPLIKEIKPALAALSQDDIKAWEQNGSFEVQLSTPTVIGIDEVEVVSEDIPGWSVANDGRYTVALDVTLTDELRREGIARELVNRIQNLRKAKGFEVTDRISVQLASNEVWDASAEAFGDFISAEVLAKSFDLVQSLDSEDVIEVEGTSGAIAIEVA
ncbi:MAG: isoleucine--tRNA ligase [Bacteroidia bacterium]